ncbi:MAG: leader peptidase (prepilin peptidase) / N-methyltransferase [Parcubacteria group bacterium LiPW_15]|nr:MAG: leader peptidase (prepilin peptidase) / N-methyltransferase [Parcubacteria group bacterium LiPW_15]
MELIIRFIFGLAIGSFLNVLATRYDPDKFLLTKQTMGGRSHCPRCKHILSAWELIPIFSFLVQRRKCAHCGEKISWLYPLGEISGGLILAFVPEIIFSISYPTPPFFSPVVLIWVVIFLILQLLSFIDYRFQLIPDEGTFLLVVLGALSTFAYPLKILGIKASSFLGHYAYLFGFQDSLVVNRLFGVVVAVLFFGLLILATKGKGMGMGDMKLSLGLGLIFGWPDVALVVGFAFVIGAIFGLGLMLFKKKTAKGAVPFVPFLAVGSATLFFFGLPIANWYFGLLSF